VSLLTILTALLAERLWPLPAIIVDAPLQALARALARVSAAAPAMPAAAGGVVLLLLLAVPCWALSVWLARAYWLADLLLQAVVLYFCMGYGRDLAYARAIGSALMAGDTPAAAQALRKWRPSGPAACDGAEIARLAAENALISAHRDVFGVSFWFVLLPGPSGALIYRVLRFVGREWKPAGSHGRVLERAAEAALRLMDWLPVRLTALAFAVAGNFEDAIYCWRMQAKHWRDQGEGILIAAGAGAIGVRLGLAIRENGGVLERPEMGTGESAGAEVMQGIIGLVWRALVLCLLLLALFVIAAQVGG